MGSFAQFAESRLLLTGEGLAAQVFGLGAYGLGSPADGLWLGAHGSGLSGFYGFNEGFRAFLGFKASRLWGACGLGAVYHNDHCCKAAAATKLPPTPPPPKPLTLGPSTLKE